MNRKKVTKVDGFIKRIICITLMALLIAMPSVTVRAQEDANTVKSNDIKEKDVRPDYAVYVNRAQNTVTVYRIEKDKTETPVKAMLCSTGKQGHGTPLGTFKTSDYYEWRNMIDGSWAQYAVRFNGMVLFHSVPYHKNDPSTLEYDQFNLLGERASLACVRLCVRDAKWIYDNCKRGTKVVVYEDEKDPGPLGKPEGIMIHDMSIWKGWDPTDPNPENPWKKQKNCNK